MAPQANLHMLRTGELRSVTQGLNYVMEDFDKRMSSGERPRFDVNLSMTLKNRWEVLEKLDKLIKKGIHVVLAAGNESIFQA